MDSGEWLSSWNVLQGTKQQNLSIFSTASNGFSSDKELAEVAGKDVDFVNGAVHVSMVSEPSWLIETLGIA